MKRTDNHEDAPQGKLTIVADFLPPPQKLVRRSDTVRVTSEYSKKSIDFLKKEAKKAKVPYQRMLRSLVDLYVEQHTGR